MCMLFSLPTGYLLGGYPPEGLLSARTQPDPGGLTWLDEGTCGGPA